jgi:hypothetical protein
MSGPLSSNEIEDVVSSVRRLVSTDQRPRMVSRDIGQDKLLLTPALRVVPEKAASSDRLVLTGQNLAADAELATADSAVEMMPGVATDDRLHLVDAEWEDELWSAPEAPLAEMALGAEEAEVVVAEAVAEPEPAPVVLWPESATDPAPWSEADWAEEPATPTTAFVVEEAAPDATPDTAPIAEPVVAEPPVLTLVDRVPEEEPEPAVATEAEDDAGDGLDVAGVLTAALIEDEAFRVMDEEELHVLVRTMVREELQGNLGERITRNVRKLVRAEINRALAARALD